MSKTNNSDGYLDIFEVAEGNYQNSEILLSDVLRIVHIQPIKIVFPDL